MNNEAFIKSYFIGIDKISNGKDSKGKFKWFNWANKEDLTIVSWFMVETIHSKYILRLINLQNII